MNYTIILWICWGAFGLVWIGGSIYNAYWGPKIQKKGFQSWRYWLIGLFVIYQVFKHYIPHTSWLSYRLNLPWLQMIGAIILIVSTIFTLWARIVLGVMWSSSVTVKSEHKLRTDGPYSITRHPIYSGMLGMLIGSTITDGAFFVIIFLITVAILLTKIREEEKMMIETFGEQYLEYKKRVPQLMPGLKW